MSTFEAGAVDMREEVAVSTEDYASLLLRFSNVAKRSMHVSQVCPDRKNRMSFEMDGSRRGVA